VTALIVIALIWLVPTFGLLIESLRDPAQYTQGGWWKALIHPQQLTFNNYSQLLKDQSITSSFWNTVKITVPVAGMLRFENPNLNSEAVTVIFVVAFAAWGAEVCAWANPVAKPATPSAINPSVPTTRLTKRTPSYASLPALSPNS